MGRRVRWPVWSGRRRETARGLAREMLALPEGRLTAEERERLELLVDWLGRSEPPFMLPMRGNTVHATCVAEIDALWEELQSRSIPGDPA
jgi:hypothetical protein